MRIRHLKRFRNIIILVVLIVAVILIAVRIRSISHSPSKSEAAETRLMLSAMADQDIAPIQEEIDLRRSVLTDKSEITDSDVEQILTETEIDMPPLSELKEYNYKQIFSNCVIMGDSIANQLKEYDILNSAEVIAKDGMKVSLTEDQIEAAVDLSPRVVFLTYGLNDMETYIENFDLFRDNYDEFLTRVQTALPNASIYVTLILPVTSYAVEKYPAYSYRLEYNQVIIDCCESHGIPYMDLEFTLPEEYFDVDGIHPVPNFYYGWLYCMAKGAGLL